MLSYSMCCFAQASDNTRHLEGGKTPSGETFLLPPSETRRVIMCSGQIFYTLSRARGSRKIRDVILVRLEQIAPFPHDLVTQVRKLCNQPLVTANAHIIHVYTMSHHVWPDIVKLKLHNLVYLCKAFFLYQEHCTG